MDIAQDLSQNEGIDVMAVGIGEEIDSVELKAIVSKPVYLFLTPNLDALISRMSSQLYSALSCEGKNCTIEPIYN